jgi:hypothetical protein
MATLLHATYSQYIIVYACDAFFMMLGWYGNPEFFFMDTNYCKQVYHGVYLLIEKSLMKFKF